MEALRQEVLGQIMLTLLLIGQVAVARIESGLLELRSVILSPRVDVANQPHCRE
jgi:hypothetical protein